ncbi:MAG: methylisocitrate lyase [Desulfurococcales archaeon]|nr:methylisocitrate lyase [Desulfurococcaceae archaeon]MDT7865635.1 methylisocitrate lyase [Desulfurococcales archaeon]
MVLGFMAFLYRGSLEDPGGRLRDLLRSRDIIVAPGVYGPVFALLAERMGFEALYLSGAALTGFLAMPDIGLITLSELATMTRYITRVVGVPLIVDADTGFGEAINVARTIRDLEDAGAAAIQIEDQVMPKKCGHLPGKSVIPAVDMMKKIRAAVDARRRDTLIVARTDARDVEGLEGAIERAQLYVEAGADVIFPEALRSLEEFREFARRVKAPLLANMTEFGKTPYISVQEFREAGYKVVIFPATLFRISLGAAREALEVLKSQGTQKSLLDRMMSREDFYKLIGYRDYEERDLRVSAEIEELYRRIGYKKP